MMKRLEIKSWHRKLLGILPIAAILIYVVCTGGGKGFANTRSEQANQRGQNRTPAKVNAPAQSAPGQKTSPEVDPKRKTSATEQGDKPGKADDKTANATKDQTATKKQTAPKSTSRKIVTQDDSVNRLNQTPLGNRPITSKASREGDTPLSKLFGMIAVVAVLGVACWYVFKKHLPRSKLSAGKKINIIENAAVGKGQHLALIEVENRKMLLAVTRENVSLISDLSKASSFSDVLAETENDSELLQEGEA